MIAGLGMRPARIQKRAFRGVRCATGESALAGSGQGMLGPSTSVDDPKWSKTPAQIRPKCCGAAAYRPAVMWYPSGRTLGTRRKRPQGCRTAEKASSISDRPRTIQKRNAEARVDRRS
jgi:hypothetical protein